MFKKMYYFFCSVRNILPDQKVVADQHEMLQYGQKIGLCTAVLHHAVHNTEHIPYISAGSQGLTQKVNNRKDAEMKR